jgi:hypothetical protein
LTFIVTVAGLYINYKDHLDVQRRGG